MTPGNHGRVARDHASVVQHLGIFRGYPGPVSLHVSLYAWTRFKTPPVDRLGGDDGDVPLFICSFHRRRGGSRRSANTKRA